MFTQLSPFDTSTPYFIAQNARIWYIVLVLWNILLLRTMTLYLLSKAMPLVYSSFRCYHVIVQPSLHWHKNLMWLIFAYIKWWTFPHSRRKQNRQGEVFGHAVCSPNVLMLAQQLSKQVIKQVIMSALADDIHIARGRAFHWLSFHIQTFNGSSSGHDSETEI